MNRYKFLLISGLWILSASTFAAQMNASDEQVFPSIDQSYLKQVKHYDVETIRLLNVGLNKDQVRNILGNPHFNEGIFRVREWNYVLDVKRPKMDGYLRCQLKIVFDRHAVVEKMYWKGEGCSQLLNTPDETSTPTNVDLFFAFDQYQQADLLPASQMELDKLLGSLRTNRPAHIEITGYADELGRAKYNQTLSVLRAKTVENYLIMHQIPSQLIHSQGAGSDQQKVTCAAHMSKAQLKACLQPNRRVQMNIQY